MIEDEPSGYLDLCFDQSGGRIGPKPQVCWPCYCGAHSLPCGTASRWRPVGCRLSHRRESLQLGIAPHMMSAEDKLSATFET